MQGHLTKGVYVIRTIESKHKGSSETREIVVTQSEKVIPPALIDAFNRVAEQVLAMSEEDREEAASSLAKRLDELVNGSTDPLGAVEVFATHLDLSLQHSHPEQAARSAFAAVEGYLKSYKFINTGHKGSEGPSWRMVQKRDGDRGGGTMR